MMTAVASKPKRNPRRTVEKLCTEDRKLYESIPESVGYVDHPSLRRPATERRLFGPEAEDVPVPNWRQYPVIQELPQRAPKTRKLLTQEQESLLFLRYNCARRRLDKLMIAQRRRFARSRVPEIVQWYRRVLEIRAALTNANMALVVAMAKRTRINAVEFSELVSEGNMALLRAVDKFDVARGFKFSTYACRAILKAFSRVATKAGNYRQHFPAEFDPCMEQRDEVERRPSYQRDLAIEDLQRVPASNVDQLTDVQQQVVSARFAVAGHPEVLTLEQVGRLVGLSKERVRQVQNEALTKLR